MFLKVLRYLSVLKLVMIKNARIVIIWAFKSKLYQYFVFIKKDTATICLILHELNLYVLLICGNKLVTIKVFLFQGGGVKIRDKLAISAFIFEKSRNGPILRSQIRAENTFS